MAPPELSEHRRNRLLRRADWRFLLPFATPVRAVCLASGGLRAAAELISTFVADARAEPDGGCDLAVVSDPTSETLARAFRWLRPDGTCYAEWYSLRTGVVDEAWARLHAAGFGDARFYTPWRSAERCERWVPLDAPQAQAYALDPRAPFARRVDRRGLGAGAGLLADHARRFLARRGIHAPVCAVARKPGPASAPAEPQFFGVARHGWASWGLGPTPAQLSALTLTGGARSISKVVSLLFADGARTPAVAVKMPRVPESAPGLEREGDVLDAVRVMAGADALTMPRVLFRTTNGERAESVMVGETAVLGTPLFAALTRRNYRELALRATEWLAELAARTAAPPAPAWERFRPAFDEFARDFAPVVDEADLGRTRELLASAGSLPVVCEQRDYSPWNVFVTDAGLAALDWESAELRGLPALDLTYFLAHLAFSVDRAMGARRFTPFRRSYRAALDPSSFTGAVQRDCVQLYARWLRLPPGAMRALRVFTWVSHARSEYRHFTMDDRGRPAPRTLRRSMFVRLWADELRHGARIARPQED